MPAADHASNPSTHIFLGCSNIPYPFSESVSTENHSRRAGELRLSACPPEPDKPSGFSDTAGNEHVLPPDEDGDVKIPVADSSSEIKTGATSTAAGRGYIRTVVDKFSQIPHSLSVVTGHMTSSAAGGTGGYIRAVVGRISHRLPFGSSNSDPKQTQEEPGTGGKVVATVQVHNYYQ